MLNDELRARVVAGRPCDLPGYAVSADLWLSVPTAPVEPQEEQDMQRVIGMESTALSRRWFSGRRVGSGRVGG